MGFLDWLLRRDFTKRKCLNCGVTFIVFRPEPKPKQKYCRASCGSSYRKKMLRERRSK